MKIEFYSPTIRRKEMDAVLTALVEDMVGPGEQAAKLVVNAKEYLQYDYCLTLRSPAIALELALKSLSLAEGSAVVISALAPRYYLQVLAGLRITPLFCDVDESSPCMTGALIKAALAREAGFTPRAIVVDHTLGFVPDLPEIIELGLPVIEDCSRSFGSNYGEKKAGSFGMLSILGMEERDPLTAGGGALLYAMGRREGSVLRTYAGIPKEYRLPDMNAAMALVQLKEGERNYRKRMEIAQVYQQAALRTRHRSFIQGGNGEYNNYAFPLVLETGMKDVASYASKKDVLIESAFQDTVAGSQAVSVSLCPVACSLALRTALFPLYPRLASSQIAKVAKVIATLP